MESIAETAIWMMAKQKAFDTERGVANMAGNERVPLKEAARILGMSQQGVREHMKRNLFQVPIGYVTNPNGRNQYHIYRQMLDRHLGIEKKASAGEMSGGFVETGLVDAK